MKQIKIRIFPDGHIQAETNGIKGSKCINYIKTLEKLLGAQTVESAFTDEYYQVQTDEQLEDTVRQNDK